MSSETLDTARARGPLGAAGRALTITLVVVLVAELMNALDGSIVHTALPTIQAETGATSAAVQWIPAAYTLVFALGLITGGRLGDLYGRKRVFLLGTGAFTLASLLCGLATGPAMLIAARALQGGAAAVMVPQVLATLYVSFDGAARAKAFGLYGLIMSLGGVLGPVLGGVLTGADLFELGWRSIFLINIPIGLAAVALGLRFIPESSDPHARRLDPLGILLCSSGLLLIVYPLTVGGQYHWPAWSVAMMIGGVAVLTAFVAHQRTKIAGNGSPLLALTLFRSRSFVGGVSSQLIFGLVSGVFLLTWTLFMQDGLGLSPARFAPAAAAVAIGGMGGAMIASKLALAHARRVPQAGALLVAATLLGYQLLVSVQGTEVPFAAAVAPMLALGCGFGMIGAGLAGLALGQVDPADMGAASGVFNTAMQVGTALGIALTSVAYFVHAPAGAHGTEVTDAFAAALRYVIGALVLMWALIFLLPRRQPRG
ncbi:MULTISPECIES: MFS transporter [unclassified Nocardia]|uniref:MFS transporter n=1 Tax=unclassified Nocardia TaxID=2637762 RepID=UPI0024A8F3CE|nr:MULTISPECIES: MFS transporter [unclassified Nocardia]